MNIIRFGSCPFLLLCVFLSVVLLSSCSDDDKGNNPAPTTSTVLKKLQKAYDESLTVEEIKGSQGNMIFVLSDKTTIELASQYNVIDIDNTAEPEIHKSDKNTWVLNGKDLNIPVVKNPEQSRIVCVAYDINQVNVHLSDSRILVLKRSGEEGILYFKIDARLNPGIKKTVAGTIYKQMITVVLPEGDTSESLIASFGYRGASVTVKGKTQQSGETSNDFTSPLTYTLKTTAGETVDYVVSVKSMRLPKVYVDTENQAGIPDRENYVRSAVRIEDADQIYSNGEAFDAPAGIRGRGNSTWGMPKKPYKIKLDKKAKLLGMSTDKEWALLANYSDKTLLRNFVAFEMSRIVGMDWTPKCVSVEFYLNGEYKGVYALTEHKKVSEERYNMELAEPSDISGEAITGGYLLEVDEGFDETYRFKTALKNVPFMFSDPDEPVNAQFLYVQDHINQIEKLLYSENFTDPENGYRKYIDIESFIKFYIVQEVAKNCDGNMRKSCYLALPRNEKLRQAFVWDFDIAFGNAEHIVTEQGATSAGWDGWYIKTRSPWFDRFFKDPVFVQELKRTWNKVKPELEQLPVYIQQHADYLQYAQARNFSPVSDGGAGWNIHAILWPSNVNRGGYQDEIEFLKNFVAKRVAWLDDYINAL